MDDHECLIWVHQRLIEYYDENPGDEHMIQLRAIIYETPYGNNSMNNMSIVDDGKSLSYICGNVPHFKSKS